MKRRSFLQQTSLLLAAWGTSQAGLALAVDRSRQVLAQSTNRKLALLVGINQYRGAALQGCLTDVDLQRELLIHRFGFQPSDILTLIDQQATRSQIETAFIEHLINPSKAGDVIVFHFSGHGSLLNLGTAREDAQTSLVTIDDPVDADSIVNRLPEDTLLLLLKSLPTDQVTTILDAGYADTGAALQGNLRIRSQPMPSANHLQDAEIAFQAQRLEMLNLDRPQLRGQRQAKQFPGVVLAAANSNQFVAETRWTGFDAGLLTYALTQQLWQATPATTLRVVLSRAAEEIGRSASQQQPSLEGQKSRDRPLTPYHSPVLQVSADGVVMGVEEDGKTGQIWLAGLSPQVLEQYSVNSLLTVDGETSPQLQVYARDGLIAKARLLSSSPDQILTVGQRVQEAVRILPRNLGLSVALDSTLERIERVDAVSAFSAIPHLSAIPAGEQPADYLFGKVSANTQVATLPSASIAGLVTPSGYGLFSQGREMISSTPGEAGEAVKVAIKRLAPQLQTLLAAKLLNFTVNERSSRLAVCATLETTAPQSQILIDKKTDRAQGQSDPILTAPLDGRMPNVAIGSHIQYRIQNHSRQPIYALLIGLDSSSNAFAFHAADTPIPPEETLIGSATSSTFAWVVQRPIGLTETHLICSRAPFSQTQTLLAETFKQNSELGTICPLPNSLEVAQAVLQDLHQASQVTAPGDTYALDVNAWATFRFSYQVV